MVGDNLDTDILFGGNGGLKTLLVLSGVTSAETAAALLQTAESGQGRVCPDFVAGSIAELLPALDPELTSAVRKASS